MLVPSNIVACFRVGLVRKKIPEFSWLHCGRRHLVSHVTVRDRTMACNFATFQLGAGVLVPSNIVACFRVGLVRKKIPEFSWLHCGRRHLVSHVTVRDRTMACNFFLLPSHKLKLTVQVPQ